MKKTTKIDSKILGYETLNDKAMISVTVLDSNELLSPFCADTPLISDSFASYLDNVIKNIPVSYNLIINIKTSSNDDEDLIKSAIINYYSNIRTETTRDIIRNKNISVIMLIIGVIIISIMITLSIKNIGEIWSTILEIIGWVFIWEAVDKFFFDNSKLRLEHARCSKIIQSDINFLE